MIGQGVVIQDCIIWDNVTIQDNCHLQSALVAENVVIGSGAQIKAGAMVDRNVQLKSNVVLEESTIASCLVVSTNEKGDINFVTPAAAVVNEQFTVGQVCYLPMEMKLEKYQ